MAGKSKVLLNSLDSKNIKINLQIVVKYILFA